MIYVGRGQKVTQDCWVARSGSAAYGICEAGSEERSSGSLVVAGGANCSQKTPERHLQMLEWVAVGPFPVQGSVLCPAGCGVYAGVQWAEPDHQIYGRLQHH